MIDQARSREAIAALKASRVSQCSFRVELLSKGDSDLHAHGTDLGIEEVGPIDNLAGFNQVITLVRPLNINDSRALANWATSKERLDISIYYLQGAEEVAVKRLRLCEVVSYQDFQGNAHTDAPMQEIVVIRPHEVLPLKRFNSPHFNDERG